MDANVPVPDPKNATKLRRNRGLFLAILGMFVVPILVAYWFAVVNPSAVPHRRLNHGALLEPPIEVAANTALAPLGKLALPISDWALLYYGPGDCDDACAARVKTLADIRELLGKDGPRVHVVAVTDGAGQAPQRATAIVDRSARAALAAGVTERVGAPADAAIVFLDWRGFVMMHFAPNAPPGDIKADLKRLLTASATH